MAAGRPAPPVDINGATGVSISRAGRSAGFAVSLQQVMVFTTFGCGGFGCRAYYLQGTQALKITAPQQPTITGPAAQIMQDRLGWVLPLEAMGAWLAGAPASSLSMSASTSDSAGRLQQIIQADWTITFADHRQVDGQWRPERIVIKGKGLTLDVSIRHPRAVMT